MTKIKPNSTASFLRFCSFDASSKSKQIAPFYLSKNNNSIRSKNSEDDVVVERENPYEIKEKHISEGSLLGPQKGEMKGRKTLVLDMDETLITASDELWDFIKGDNPVADFKVKVDEEDVGVAKRPGLDEFLEKLGKLYEIVILTAGQEIYAKPVLDAMDTKKVIQYRIYSDENPEMKALKPLGRDMSQIVLIDDQYYNFKKNPENGIHIGTFRTKNKTDDTALIELLPLLTKMADPEVKDVRTFLKKNAQELTFDKTFYQPSKKPTKQE